MILPSSTEIDIHWNIAIDAQTIAELTEVVGSPAVYRSVHHNRTSVNATCANRRHTNATWERYSRRS